MVLLKFIGELDDGSLHWTKKMLSLHPNTGKMLPGLHKDFAMIKEKIDNECMEQSSL